MSGFVNPAPWVPKAGTEADGAAVTKKSRMKILVIVGIVVLIVAICVGGGFGYVNHRNAVAAKEAQASAAEEKRVAEKNAKQQADVAKENQALANAQLEARTGKVGDVRENTGIRMKLVSFGDVATIGYDTCGEGCSNGIYAAKQPDNGTKYWVANVEITNTSKQPIDISCSYPVAISALDSSQQQYSPIENLYQVQGNPACNADLQPGMTSKVSYPFQIPSDTHIVGISWYGVDLNASTAPEPNYFITDNNYTLSAQ